MKKKHTYIEVTDIGDTVLCDYCNKEWPATNQTSGGVLSGSYAICPDCAPAAIESAQKYNEMHRIKRCPEGLSFHEWVMRLRGGDNTIKVITKGDS